jgi:hypothetical protein
MRRSRRSTREQTLAEPTSTDTSPVDFKQAKRDYGLLIGMLKWGAVISLIIGFLVMIIISD